MLDGCNEGDAKFQSALRFLKKTTTEDLSEQDADTQTLLKDGLENRLKNTTLV